MAFLAFFCEGLNLLEHVDVGHVLLVMVQKELENPEELDTERERRNQP